MYGADVEKNDPSSSPFHSSHPPSISLRDYFLGRIVKYTHMQSSDFVLAVIFINKLLNARQPAPLGGPNGVAVSLSAEDACSLPSEGSRQSNSSMSSRPARKATTYRVVAREDGIEFNVLTAHRVLLTACLIANKVQYDRGIILKHWAKLGGLERDEAVTLEATFLHIIDCIYEHTTDSQHRLLYYFSFSGA
ncbi:putative cyclin domain containing protein [Neospora caninum Liverpool]|uniref:Cyclin domain containing protein, putative n=1 Tax=Neospora caninum (strain Liverpool) TaxID=572307 RepID=F0VEK2_NEOCL|nr:putative cyclin domain containing protein [Neospora caninum Liverpool]CBZ52146.1 putative cyclin domain containing protein [Neospora caninum Liverpool]CEL66109.1 TPA: cyclin domain containing protein, putative [Neospora caninum Liverpool]|eukprot:XP_003882178.1 putative cyclin domain containing protein [Neospora caninum Liverpool]